MSGNLIEKLTYTWKLLKNRETCQNFQTKSGNEFHWMFYCTTLSQWPLIENRESVNSTLFSWIPDWKGWLVNWVVHDKPIVLTPTVMVVWVSGGVGPLDGRAGWRLFPPCVGAAAATLGDVARGLESVQALSVWVNGDALRFTTKDEPKDDRIICPILCTN